MKRNNIAIRFEKQYLDNLVEDEGSCVEILQRNHHLALHPYHLNNIGESLKDILNKGIARFDKNLGGILLGYTNIKLLSQDGVVTNDSFFIHIDLTATFYIFKPEVGKILTGTVNKKSKDHVGCLVHKTFNVSLPRPGDEKDTDEEWMGTNVEIGQDILLRITFANLEARLPYIRATFVAVLSEQDSGFSTNEEHVSKSKRIVFDSNSENEVEVETTKKKKKRKKKDVSEDDASKNTLEEHDETQIKKKKHKHKLHKKEDDLEPYKIFKDEQNSYEELQMNGKYSSKKSKKHKLKDQDHDLEQQDVNKQKKRKHQIEEEYLESKTTYKKKKSKHKSEIIEDVCINGDGATIEEYITKKKKHKHKDRSYEQEFLESETTSDKKLNHNNSDDIDYSSITKKRKHDTSHEEKYLDTTLLASGSLKKVKKSRQDLTNDDLQQTNSFSKKDLKKKRNKEINEHENEIKTQIWETQDPDLSLPELNLSTLFNESSSHSKLTPKGNFMMADNEDKKSTKKRALSSHLTFWNNNLISPSISDPEEQADNTSIKHKSKKKSRDADLDSSRKRRRSDSSGDFEISRKKKRIKE